MQRLGQTLQRNFAKDVLAGNGPKTPAVGAVVAIVAHDEEFVFAEAKQFVAASIISIGSGVGRKVRFNQQLSINIYLALPDLNRLSRHCDNAFDVGRVIARVSHGDDVVLAGVINEINKPVQPIVSRIKQSGIHAGALHLDGLEDKMRDEQIV